MPVIVRDVPITPELGLIDVITGVGISVNVPAFLEKPNTVTTRFPVVAPLGTSTEICGSLQDVAVADVPLKVTVLDPCVAPKPDP
jgi:hypothetical protein